MSHENPFYININLPFVSEERFREYRRLDSAWMKAVQNL
jgi:hypothetical protein